MPLAIGHITATTGEERQAVAERLASFATDNTGSTGGSYSSSEKIIARIESGVTGRRGASIQVYDPELSAFLRGEF